MCDTSVAIGSATVDRSVIFAKNSDRPANECQQLRYYPCQQYSSDATVRCTYREIPQARETFAVLGSQPWWIWGFEMGVNERGVVIGNEAVYGREGYADDGLLGMDLLRLGLERGRTASDALHVMIHLLEEFGQGGSADVSIQRFYHNSYIVADGQEAWVFETAGRYWAAERVKGRRAISNCYTIGTEWDLASADLVDYAVKNGWWDPGQDFNFALAYGDPNRDTSSGQCRFARATSVLGNAAKLSVADMMVVLRDHAGIRTDASGETVVTPICMHETPPNLGATAASLVVQLRPSLPEPLSVLVWHSFGSPCLGAFHPLYVRASTPSVDLAIGGGSFDARSPWWRNERIQRTVDQFPALKPKVQAILGGLESRAFDAVCETEERVVPLSAVARESELQRLSQECTAEFLAMLDHVDEVLSAEHHSPTISDAGAEHWDRLNEAVGLECPRLAPTPNLVTTAT